MKKRVMLAALGVMTAVLVSGCSSKGPYGKYVTLGEYKGLEVTKIKSEVTDEVLSDEIEYVLEENTEYHDVDRAAKNGDLVNVSFTGTVDGEISEDASAEDMDLEVGAGDFLEDFENAVVGMKAGDEKTVDVDIPEDYFDETVAGQKITFDITVNSISEVKKPELTDEFVSSISEYQTVDEYKEGLRKELLDSMEADNSYTAGSDALYMVIENSTFDGYPEDLYEECETLYEESNQYYAELLGMDVADLEGSEEETKEAVVSLVNEEMVIQSIAAKEKLEVSEEEYTSYVTSNLADYDCDSVEEFEAMYSKEDTMDEILREKVQNFLLENAAVTEISEEEYYGDGYYDGEDYEDDGDMDLDETEPLEDGEETDALLDTEILDIDDAQAVTEEMETLDEETSDSDALDVDDTEA